MKMTISTRLNDCSVNKTKVKVFAFAFVFYLLLNNFFSFLSIYLKWKKI